jgi:hypothetical protein
MASNVSARIAAAQAHLLAKTQPPGNLGEAPGVDRSRPDLGEPPL